MSNQQSSNFTSYSSTSYSSYSSSSSSSGGQSHSQSYTERGTYNSRDGGSIERTSAETGKPTIVERTEIPVGGGRLTGSEHGQGSTQGRIEDVTDDPQQSARDQEYLEKMEDEYAKREGGA